MATMIRRSHCPLKDKVPDSSGLRIWISKMSIVPFKETALPETTDRWYWTQWLTIHRRYNLAELSSASRGGLTLSLRGHWWVPLSLSTLVGISLQHWLGQCHLPWERFEVDPSGSRHARGQHPCGLCHFQGHFEDNSELQFGFSPTEYIPSPQPEGKITIPEFSSDRSFQSICTYELIVWTIHIWERWWVNIFILDWNHLGKEAHWWLSASAFSS